MQRDQGNPVSQQNCSNPCDSHASKRYGLYDHTDQRANNLKSARDLDKLPKSQTKNWIICKEYLGQVAHGNKLSNAGCDKYANGRISK